MKLEMATQGVLKYSYNTEQFVIETKLGNNSEFDCQLKSLWMTKMKNMLFRFTVDDLDTRRLSGKYAFLAQLNPKRALERRQPQFIDNVIMPFEPEKFHFGKVDKKEVLMELVPLHWEKNEADKNDELSNTNKLIINVSPLEFCSSLLVPSIEKCLPQVLNFDGLRLALETILISYDPYIKMGMNSLGAYASVNHLHFHVYHLAYILYLQYASVKHIVGDCYDLEDFPAQGFAFQLIDKENVVSISRSIMKLVEFLQNEKIAHNIFITRGKAFTYEPYTDPENINSFDAIRVYVWAREPSFGAKEDVAFNPALCELAGHLVMKVKNDFDYVEENDVKGTLYRCCHNMYTRVKNYIMQIYV